MSQLDFELSTPMLVMPLITFKRQGRIFKSVTAWRDEALSKGRLLEYARDKAGKVVVFVSHTCARPQLPRPQPLLFARTRHTVGTGWDREYLDPSRDPNDPYDKGAPDYQSGERKDLKWRLVCAGVESLVKAKGLKEKDVLLWLDWQSIYQAHSMPS